MASLFKTMALERITLEDALQLLSQPRLLGVNPADGTPIMLADSREAVVMNAHENDLETVSIH